MNSPVVWRACPHITFFMSLVTYHTSLRLLLARRLEVAARFAAAAPHFGHGLQERARGVPRFFHERFVLVEGFVTGGVVLVVADVAIEQGLCAGGYKFQFQEPVAQCGAD